MILAALSLLAASVLFIEILLFFSQTPPPQVLSKSTPAQHRELCTVILASTWMWLQCLQALGGAEHSCMLEIKKHL